MFGVYSDLIYNQTCGTRAILGRPYPTPGAPPDLSRICYEGADFNLRDRLSEEQVMKSIVSINTLVFDAVLKEIETDKDKTWIRNFFLGTR